MASFYGCHDSLVYTQDNFIDHVDSITNGHGFDIVFDSVGADTFKVSLEIVAKCGHLVNFGQSSGVIDPLEVQVLAKKSLTISRPILFHYIDSIEKFGNLLLDMSEEKSLTSNQVDKEFEDQIYDGFPDAKDNYLMKDFHAALPEKKYEIVEKIGDLRCKEFAKRVMYNQFPEFLPKNELKKRDLIVAKNHLTLEDRPWCTIPQAQNAIDDLRETEEDVNLKRLDEIDGYIQSLVEKFELILFIQEY